MEVITVSNRLGDLDKSNKIECHKTLLCEHISCLARYNCHLCLLLLDEELRNANNKRKKKLKLRTKKKTSFIIARNG